MAQEITISKKTDGAFAVVMIQKESKIVYKIFKSFNYPGVDRYEHDEESFNTYRRKVFESEKAAYELIAKHNIKRYFPIYYGPCDFTMIKDNNGYDISKQFLLDCCLILELIDGDCCKQNDEQLRMRISETGQDLDSIFQQVKEIGVAFFEDASVFFDGKNVKIIDIATQDFADFEII